MGEPESHFAMFHGGIEHHDPRFCPGVDFPSIRPDDDFFVGIKVVQGWEDLGGFLALVANESQG